MENIVKIITNGEYFSVKDTLECGQVFRFVAHKKGYKIHSLNKCAYCYNEGENAVIECLESDREYFVNYFDLARDYKAIFDDAVAENVDILTDSAKVGKGIRILNQDRVETLFSFIISQNNNIPRIKSIIEKICTTLGEKRAFNGEEFFSFPSVDQMAKQSTEFYQGLGLGYRAEYVRRLAVDIVAGFNINKMESLPTTQLKKSLVGIYGVGPKVADCVSLFGFHRADSFPVDTWIEKVYLQDFNGTLKDRTKIADYFVKRFKGNPGYYQQYLFYYARLKEKSTLIK